jgi:serine protease Do
VWFEELSDEVKTALKVDHGVQVSRVQTGGPADKGGLKAGDILLEFAGRKIEDGEKFRYDVAKSPIGKPIPFKVLRGKQTLTLQITLTEQPDEPMVAMGRDRTSEKLGIAVQELTDALANRLGYKGENGVVVTKVDPDGPAARATPAPIKETDLIQEVDQKPVTSLETYAAAVDAGDVARGILMLVRSADGTRRFVVVKQK